MQNEDEFFARFDCGRQWHGYIAVLTGLHGDDTKHPADMGTRDRVHGEITGLGAVTEFAATLLFEMA